PIPQLHKEVQPANFPSEADAPSANGPLPSLRESQFLFRGRQLARVVTSRRSRTQSKVQTRRRRAKVITPGGHCRQSDHGETSLPPAHQPAFLLGPQVRRRGTALRACPIPLLPLPE